MPSVRDLGGGVTRWSMRWGTVLLSRNTLSIIRPSRESKPLLLRQNILINVRCLRKGETVGDFKNT